MMGRQGPPQSSLFYHRFNLEQRVRKDHILRKIDAAVDFDFIYREVEALYGVNGNGSVPPPVILRLMVLLVFYNVRSERELMATLPERLDASTKRRQMVGMAWSSLRDPPGGDPTCPPLNEASKSRPSLIEPVERTRPPSAVA